MTGESAAPAEMPSEEDVARALCIAQGNEPDFDYDPRGVTDPAGTNICWKLYLGQARAILDLFAPILAEKERAERDRCIAIVDAQVPDWVKERSGPYWEGYRDAMEDAAEDMRKGAPARAAAIRAQGDTAQQDLAG